MRSTSFRLVASHYFPVLPSLVIHVSSSSVSSSHLLFFVSVFRVFYFLFYFVSRGLVSIMFSFASSVSSNLICSFCVPQLFLLPSSPSCIYVSQPCLSMVVTSLIPLAVCPVYLECPVLEASSICQFKLVIFSSLNFLQ